MPESTGPTPEAVALACAMCTDLVPGWLYGMAQRAIDAGWTPPPGQPDPHVEIAMEMRDAAWPSTKGTPFPVDEVDERLIDAVRRLDLRRGA